MWLTLVPACGWIERPAPSEVLALFPLPGGASIEDHGCVGAPRTQGFTCVAHGELPGGVARDDAVWAATRFAEWEEVTWDRVPGRIQLSWSRDREHVSLALHDLPDGTKWSWSYTFGTFPAPYDPDPLAQPFDPAAAWPGLLQAAPRPADAALHRAEEAPPWATAVYRTATGPSEVVDLLRYWPGAEELLLGRGYGRSFAVVRVGDHEYKVVAEPTDTDTVATVSVGPSAR